MGQRDTPPQEPVCHPKFSRPVYGDQESFRFATPEVVAGYRAQRLSTNVAADLCCGVGGQAIALAHTCDRVLASDLDPGKVRYARLNAQEYGVDNIEFRVGDAFSEEIQDWVRGNDVDLVFCDPSRPPTEDARSLESLSPRINDILNAYGWVESFAFEAPPQLKYEDIPFDCEKEYLSLEGELNRLILYFGGRREADRSAAVLPGGHRLLSKNMPIPGRSKEIRKYLYEVDPAVVRAGVIGELAGRIASSLFLVVVDNSPFLTSDDLERSPFLKNRFAPRGQVALDPGEINVFLRAHHAGSAVPRWNVPPDQYWDVRGKLERGLSGKRVYHVFEYEDQALVCEKI